jgi:hypothetical protein
VHRPITVQGRFDKVAQRVTTACHSLCGLPGISVLLRTAFFDYQIATWQNEGELILAAQLEARSPLNEESYPLTSASVWPEPEIVPSVPVASAKSMVVIAARFLLGQTC